MNPESVEYQHNNHNHPTRITDIGAVATIFSAMTKIISNPHLAEKLRKANGSLRRKNSVI
jgi:hypothetical protein